MKTYKQTSEIFDYARLFHKMMRNFYEHLYERNEKQRIKMLLDYLSQHEKHRKETLAKYKKEASNKIMDTWFQYVPENISLNFLKNVEINTNMSVDELVDISMRLNNCLIEFYKGLIKETKIEEVKDVFNSLFIRMEQEKKDLVRNASSLNDI